MLGFVDITCIPKSEFITTLSKFFNNDDDDDFSNLKFLVPSQLNTLLERLKDNIWFITERPYVDKHYRDTYYAFHSSKFYKIGRNCIRVHLFEGEVAENDLFDLTNALNERYRGFFIIRPLMHHILGRSLISPEAFKTNNFFCCLTKGRVSLLGRNLSVYGFPHIAQDEETHTCAESALWCHIEYYGSKYPQYKSLLPSKIVKTLLDSPDHRILPSIGLTNNELTKCLNDNGFQCLIYDTDSGDNKKTFFQLLKIYVESGIPLLLFISNKKEAHAVLVIGHEKDESVHDVQSTWIDTSSIEKKMVFIDDNMPPYQMASLSEPTDHYENEMNDMEIVSFIVALPVHVYLVAEKAYDLMYTIFEDEQIGLQTFNGKWISRLLLTGSQSFKNFILNDDNNNIMPDEIKQPLLSLSLPKFIWMCELYKAENFNPDDGYCSGLLLIDPTTNGKSLTPILFYAIGDKLLEHDCEAWKGFENIVEFKMPTYKNNLKGEWSKWQSGMTG
ncbi:MAG: hypothetical protein FWB95_04980 [Treponema sp.]|nr:hypothetical protein [Treponema sp.]